jgi:hypothetical protein
MPFMTDRWGFFCRTVSLTANKALGGNILTEKHEISSLRDNRNLIER